jgi:hypothetical protein
MKRRRKKVLPPIQLVSVGVPDPEAVAKAGATLLLDIIRANRLRGREPASQGECLDQAPVDESLSRKS